jgi:hypothetical protein
VLGVPELPSAARAPAAADWDGAEAGRDAPLRPLPRGLRPEHDTGPPKPAERPQRAPRTPPPRPSGAAGMKPMDRDGRRGVAPPAGKWAFMRATRARHFSSLTTSPMFLRFLSPLFYRRQVTRAFSQKLALGVLAFLTLAQLVPVGMALHSVTLVLLWGIDHAQTACRDWFSVSSLLGFLGAGLGCGFFAIISILVAALLAGLIAVLLALLTALYAGVEGRLAGLRRAVILHGAVALVWLAAAS